MPESQEVAAEELFELADDPFVRHQIDPRTVERVWLHGAAWVIQGGRHRSHTTALNRRPGPRSRASDPSPVERSPAHI